MPNTVTLTLPRDEVFQIIVTMSKRLEGVRNHIESTDYATKFGQDMGEKVRHDDETFALEMQRTIARIIDVL